LDEEAERAENLAKAAALHSALRAALTARHGESLGEMLFDALLAGDTVKLLDADEQGSEAG